MSAPLAEFTPESFDASSAAWAANKIRRGASYAYRCEAVTKTGAPCKDPASARPTEPQHLCKRHQRYKPTLELDQ